jgi:hypothetical protein
MSDPIIEFYKREVIRLDALAASNANSQVKKWAKDSSADMKAVLAANPTLIGPIGPAGSVGVRGSKFLGCFATSDDLPIVDNINVLLGDFAYLETTGEIWYTR